MQKLSTCPYDKCLRGTSGPINLVAWLGLDSDRRCDGEREWDIEPLNLTIKRRFLIWRGLRFEPAIVDEYIRIMPLNYFVTSWLINQSVPLAVTHHQEMRKGECQLRGSRVADREREGSSVATNKSYTINPFSGSEPAKKCLWEIDFLRLRFPKV